MIRFIIIIVIIIVCVIIYNILHIKYNSFSNKKQLKYFGSENCPYSNTDSMAFKVIKDFENKYGKEVEIMYYWNEEDMKKNNIIYVPTILSGNNKIIELKLPSNINKDNMTDDELKDSLLNNIFKEIHVEK